MLKAVRPINAQLTVIHDGRGHILARYALVPGGLHVQVKPWLAAVLAGVPQVPLEREVGVAGRTAVIVYVRVRQN